MPDQSDPTTRRRTPLSKERVLHAAVALADEGGITALTMRRLAQRLGVEAMSLYNHVANKDEILDGIVELVAGEIELPDDADWRTATRQRAISTRDVFERHPWAPGVWMSRVNIGPSRLRYMESLLGGLRAAGFSSELTYLAFHVLESHVLGFALQEQSFRFGADELRELGAAFVERLPADQYPYLTEHVRQHLGELSHVDENDFEFGLDLILDGLERLRAAG